jgi:hypothetical protein
MIGSKGRAYLACHAANVIEPADALLVLEVTSDTGQRLTRPAAGDGIPQLADQRPRPAP